MSSIHGDVVEILSRLGVASLSRYVGEDKVSRFISLGLPISSDFLSEVLYIEQGIRVFKNKSLRLELMASLGKEKLTEILGDSDSLYEELQRFNEFSWGDNSKTKEFLGLFEIDDQAVVEKDKKTPSEFVVEIPFCLHPYQNWVRKNILGFFHRKDQSRTLVHMPTGAGKTRTSMEALCDFLRESAEAKKSVIWLAHSEELCEQAVESFETSWRKLGTQPAKVLRVWGGRDIDVDFDDDLFFAVISFQTAYGMITSKDDNRFKLASKMRKQCGLLVVDEAHQSTAPTYKEVIDVLAGQGTTPKASRVKSMKHNME